MNSLWNREPASILGALGALLALGMAFGLHLSAGQVGAIMAAATAVNALITRQTVTSPSTLQNLTPSTLAAAQDAAQPVKETIRKLPVVLLACMLGTVLFGCSISLKQKAVVGLQSAEVALEAAQGLERGYCFNQPSIESGPHCTNPQAATLKLTDATHQNMAQFFSHAYAVQLQAVPVLQAWKAGDPAPSGVATYQADLTQLMTLAKNLDPAASDLVAKIQAALDAAAQIALAVGVTP